MSRKPCVVSSAQGAPVRSRMVLIATVVPCRNSRAERKRAPALVTPASMPSTSRAGCVSVLPSLSSPVVSSNAATSVKVPPTSADSLIWFNSIALKQLPVGWVELLRDPTLRATALNCWVSRRARPNLHGHRRTVGGDCLPAQFWHHLVGEEADRAQAFLARQIAEGELADVVVAARLV